MQAFKAHSNLVSVVGSPFRQESWMPMLAGGGTNVIVGVVASPPDVVKTRMHNNGMRGTAQQYSGVIDCIRQIYQKEGARAFFNGASMRVARIAPGTGCACFFSQSLCRCVSCMWRLGSPLALIHYAHCVTTIYRGSNSILGS